MNSFEKASLVEQESWEILKPFIAEKAFEGRFVKTAKGPLAKELQKTVGDVLYNSDDDTVWSIEIKAERRFTGNCFLEVWSNRKRNTPGWMETTRCDILLCHYLSNDSLYGFHFSQLREWFSEHGQQYPLVEQRRYSQLNDTWGRLVRLRDIPKSITLGVWNPELMALTPDCFESHDEWLARYASAVTGETENQRPVDQRFDTSG